MAKKKVAAQSKEKSKTPSFEEAIEQLETIVHDLEEGQVGLEESLARYESGVKLLRHCYNLLGRAERRIELLSQVDDQGNPITEPFGEEGDETLSEKAASRSRRRTARPTSDAPSSSPPSSSPPSSSPPSSSPPSSSSPPNSPPFRGDSSPGEPDNGIDDSPLLF